MRAHESRGGFAFTPSPAAVLRRKCACGGGGSADCEECRRKPAVQRSAVDDAVVGEAPAAVHETLQSAGRPLDPAPRAFMEARLGHDFSRVRVHADAAAARSARQIHASAYSLGPHVVFAGGPPSIATAEGRRLLAHELAHTVQQKDADAGAASIRVGSASDASEREADAAATALDRGRAPLTAAAAGGTAVRRQPDDNPRQKTDDPRPEPFDPTGAPTVDIPGVGEMEVNPSVIAPDMDGVPDFMRGKEVKLSDLRKVLDAIGLGRKKRDPKGEPKGFCEQFQMERGEKGAVEGLCCPKFKRDPRVCCKSTNMDVFQHRCCGTNEVAIGGKCIAPKVVPGPLPNPPGPKPKPQPQPAPAPAPVPVSTVVYFEQDKPGAAAKGEEGLRKSLTADGAKGLDLLVKELKENPTFKVQLTGKASSEGTPGYNLGLAGRRARLLADVLVAMGVDRSRITEPKDGGSECKKEEDGIHNCGETGAAKDPSANDRQVAAKVFAEP